MDDGKKKKGFLKRAWDVVKSPVIAVPAAILMTLVIGPLVVDMGTWYSIFHNPDNLRAAAFGMKMNPLTSWLPYHMGLTEPGGFLYDTMTAFLGPELETLIAQRDAASAADAIVQNGNAAPLIAGDYGLG